jgi:hypothetical protein
MADKTVKYGTVSITVPDYLVPPEEAGTLSPVEVSRIPRAPRAVGTLCDLAADGIERAGKAFQAPAGVTADSLRKAGERADGMDQVIQDIEVLLNRYKQGNLLVDSAAYAIVRQVNDQIKVQAKQNPELNQFFAQLLQAMVKLRGTREEHAPAPAPAPAPTPKP